MWFNSFICKQNPLLLVKLIVLQFYSTSNGPAVLSVGIFEQRAPRFAFVNNKGKRLIGDGSPEGTNNVHEIVLTPSPGGFQMSGRYLYVKHRREINI